MADERARGETGVRREGREAKLGLASLAREEITERGLDLAEIQTRKLIFVTVEQVLG